VFRVPRSVALTVLAVGAATAMAGSAPPLATSRPAPIPVILATDIGAWIDDTWALVMLLRSPELDLRLVVTDSGDTVYRAKIVARLLEIAGRTDVPIAVGPSESDAAGGQADWVRGYDLTRYPGRIYRDGVRALVDTVIASSTPLTLISISPNGTLKAALERAPGIAGKLRLAGMYGSLRRGDGGKPGAEPEWNVKTNTPAARAVLGAPWLDAIVTPLDTCSVVQLRGARYARVRDAEEPLLRALMENYRLWCPHQDREVCAPGQPEVESTVLYDTVAVYLSFSRAFLQTERLGVRVTDAGMTVEDAARRPLTWATRWTSLDDYEGWLAARLAGASVKGVADTRAR
jgi:inosine-uridine nucleoside N-ribohydrolase